MARPRKTLPPGGLDTIKRLAAYGVQETVIAAALGMDAKTWKRIREEDPEAKAAWEEARAAEQDALVGSLFRQAIGAPAEHDEDGNVIRAELSPFAPAGMFLLKARHGYRDNGPGDAGEARAVVHINLPAPLNPEQFARLIETTPAVLPPPSNHEAP